MEPQVPSLAQARIVHGALLSGSFAVGVVVWFVTRDGGLGGEPIPVLGDVALILAGVMLVAAVSLRALLKNRAARASGPDRALLCFQAGLVPMAMLEGATLFQLMVWLLNGEPLPHAAVAGFLWLVGATLWPPSPDDL
ncbi:MAG: hypothetical protein AB7O97_19875 [Planctomycetota bacterium]